MAACAVAVAAAFGAVLMVAPANPGRPASTSPPSGRPLPAAVETAAVPAPWVTTRHAITVDGVSRTYLTVVPTAAQGTLPVIVLLHGRGGEPAAILVHSGLTGLDVPAILIVPQGWESSWNAGDCCGLAYQHAIDDVGFIRTALHDVVSSEPHADPSRVYVVGFSNGGRMAYRLACDLPGTFAGFVAVEAVPVGPPCRSMRPLNIVIVAQERDPLLSFGSGQAPKHIYGFTEPTVTATVASLKGLDGCGIGTTGSAGGAIVRTWPCAAGTYLRYVWYPGGAHNWRPSSAGTPGVDHFIFQLLQSGSGHAV
ncbi:MAG: hypothetical protein JO337_00220 [Acidimicrobiales bacterium]|nr:hypothetical protein [Acidimicrobiales bacterium]